MSQTSATNVLRRRSPSDRRSTPAVTALASPARAVASVSWQAPIRLLAGSCVPIALLALRFDRTGQPTYTFLLWNLLLAWLPLIFAFLAAGRGRARPWSRLLCGAAWLLFFPNAPYILTDLMHLRPRNDVPVLFDAALLFSFALYGLALGFTSLRWMQEAVSRRFGRWIGGGFALASLSLASFGIYLGRVLRWNSWDALLRPAELWQDVLPRLANPLDHGETWKLWLLYAVVLVFAYWLMSSSFDPRTRCSSNT